MSLPRLMTSTCADLARYEHAWGEYMTSITRQLVFLITGELPSDERDKGHYISTDLKLTQD